MIWKQSLCLALFILHLIALQVYAKNAATRTPTSKTVPIRYKWLHPFMRRGNSKTFPIGSNKRTDFLFLKGNFFGVKKKGNFIAVKLPLLRERIDYKTLEENFFLLIEENFLKNSNAYNNWSKLQNKKLIVYLIGKDGYQSNLPKLTVSLLKLVHKELSNSNLEQLSDVTFPAFYVQREIKFTESYIKSFLNQTDIDSKITKLLKRVQGQIEPLCIDENGINGGNLSIPFQYGLISPRIFNFNEPFWFVLAHAKTGVPLVISKVESSLPGSLLCLQAK